MEDEQPTRTRKRTTAYISVLDACNRHYIVGNSVEAEYYNRPLMLEA